LRTVGVFDRNGDELITVQGKTKPEPVLQPLVVRKNNVRARYVPLCENRYVVEICVASRVIANQHNQQINKNSLTLQVPSEQPALGIKQRVVLAETRSVQQEREAPYHRLASCRGHPLDSSGLTLVAKKHADLESIRIRFEVIRRTVLIGSQLAASHRTQTRLHLPGQRRDFGVFRDNDLGWISIHHAPAHVNSASDTQRTARLDAEGPARRISNHPLDHIRVAQKRGVSHHGIVDNRCHRQAPAHGGIVALVHDLAHLIHIAVRPKLERSQVAQPRVSRRAKRADGDGKEIDYIFTLLDHKQRLAGVKISKLIPIQQIPSHIPLGGQTARVEFCGLRSQPSYVLRSYETARNHMADQQKLRLIRQPDHIQLEPARVSSPLQVQHTLPVDVDLPQHAKHQALRVACQLLRAVGISRG